MQTYNCEGTIVCRIASKNLDIRCQTVFFWRGRFIITEHQANIEEIGLWLTLHAFVSCSLQRTPPSVSSCSGTGCCWAEWQATTRPSTSVLRPGGPLSWLSWSWKDERNLNVPPTASVSHPGNATAGPVLFYWHVHIPSALIILPHRAHTRLLLRYPALSSPVTWWTSAERSSA